MESDIEKNKHINSIEKEPKKPISIIKCSSCEFQFPEFLLDFFTGKCDQCYFKIFSKRTRVSITNLSEDKKR